MAVITAAFLCPVVGAADAQAEEQKKPSLAPVVKEVSRQVTTCSETCVGRDLLFGSDQSLSIAVYRTGPPGDIWPNNTRLVLQREHTGSVKVVPEDRISFTTVSGKASQNQFTVDLSDLDAPDKYTGALLFEPKGKAERVSVPVTVEVRDGPLLPLVVLIGTVFLGWFLAWILGLGDAVEFRRKAQRLRVKIDALPEAERTILRPLWDKMWKGRGDDLAQAQTRLAALTSGAEALRECRNAQDDALRVPEATKLMPWVQRIGNATGQVVQAVEEFSETYDEEIGRVVRASREFDVAMEAKLKVDDLSKRAKSASSVGTPYEEFRAAEKEFQSALSGVSTDASQAAPDLAAPLKKVEESFDALEKERGKALIASRGVAAAGIGEVSAAVGAAFGWPAQTEPTEVGGKSATTFDVEAMIGEGLGPIAAVAAMLVLLAVGFKVTYLDNATFGADLADWLTLAFWGFAAYGTRKTLTGLGSPPSAT